MELDFIIELTILAIAIIQFIVIIILFSKNRQGSQEHVLKKLIEYDQRLDKNESNIRDEFGKNREETNKSAKDSREELSSSLKLVEEKMLSVITTFTGLIEIKIKSISDSLDVSSKSNREELAKSISDFTGIVDNKMKTIQEFLDIGLKFNREELNKSISTFERQVTSSISGFSEILNKELSSVQDRVNTSTKESREELVTSLKSFEEKSSAKTEALTKDTRNSLEMNRTTVEKKLADIQEELNKSISSFEKQVTSSISGFSEILNKELNSVQDRVNTSTKESREELTASLKSFEEKSSAKIEALTKDTKDGLEMNRTTVEKKLADIQKENNEKLEQMRQTVDEKLHKTLETRLGESFKLVSERLELVQKGLGEMQNLAIGVGDLKKVLSNVKTKGVLGEYQLGSILEQILAPNQYEQNVQTKEGSRDNVEFAIKLPSKDDSNKPIWLPTDSKFPTADYEILISAYDNGDTEILGRAKKELENKINKFAKDIHEKYIDPPNTTEFAIMFLPFEGLYAEVLRIPGILENIQNKFKITIAGPTTMSAILNSLQMGFRTLAVEKRTSEIWNILGAVRTEFGKFGDVLDATKKKLDQASDELAKTGTRTRQIEKKLQDVQTLPETEAQKLLEL
jgi:DNA recombination protein RmuC